MLICLQCKICKTAQTQRQIWRAWACIFVFFSSRTWTSQTLYIKFCSGMEKFSTFFLRPQKMEMYPASGSEQSRELTLLGIKLNIIKSSPPPLKTFIFKCHQNFFLLKQELSLVILPCMFHSADVNSALLYLKKSRFSCFYLTGKTQCLSGGKRQAFLTSLWHASKSFNNQYIKQQLQIIPWIYFQVCGGIRSLGFTHDLYFDFFFYSFLLHFSERHAKTI